MSKGPYTEKQMAAVQHTACCTSETGASISHKVTQSTIYAGRKQVGQIPLADVKRLKALLSSPVESDPRGMRRRPCTG